MLLALLPSLFLLGCGDPRDKTLPFDLSTSPDAKETLAQLTPTEQQAITEYEVRRAARLAAGDESARNSVTYRQAIADQLVYDTSQAQHIAAARVAKQAEQQAAKAKAAESAAVAAADYKLAHDSITCQLTGKQFDTVPKADAPMLPMPQVTYDFNCQNTSTQAVNGFKGKLIVSGPYGESVGFMPIRRDNPLAAGGSFQLHIKSAFMNFGEGMTARTLYDMSVDKLSTKVDLDTFVKADGKIIKTKPF